MQLPSSTERNPAIWRKWIYNGDSKKLAPRLSYFRCTAPYGAQLALLPEIMRSLVAAAAIGTPFPKAYSDIQANRLPLDWNDDWIVEIAWNFSVFAKYADELNHALRIRDQIDCDLILGRISEAGIGIEETKALFGCSLMVLEREFMLSQYRGGFQANKEFLSKIHERKGSAYVLYLATLFSLRIEQEGVPLYYEKVLKQKVYSVWTDPHAKVREYICSYADPFNRTSIQEKAFCIWRDNNGALVDRYIQILKVVRREACLGCSEEDTKRLRTLVGELSKKISDHALGHVKDLLSETQAFTLESAESAQFLEALDQYTAGKYHDALDRCLALLRSDPRDFGIFELAAKCAVHQRATAPQVTENDSLANRILGHLTTIFGEEPGYDKAERGLTTIAQHLGESHLAIGIKALLDRLRREPDKYAIKLSRHYSLIDNPGAWLDATDVIATSKFRSITAANPSSITCDFLGKRASNTISKTSNDHGVEEVRWSLAIVRELITLNRADDAIKTLSSTLEKLRTATSDIPNCVAATAIELRFDALRAKGDTTTALQELCDEYISNKDLVRRLAVSDFLAEVGQPAAKEIQRTVEYLIARSMVAESVQDVYEALDDFLVANSLARPRDLLRISDQFNQRRLVFAIGQVFRRDAISRGPYCSTTAELADERLFLLNSIGALGPSKSVADIRTELSELHKEILIRAAAQHVNEGRISVQFESVREAAEVVRPYFERYRSLLDAERNANVESIPLDSIRPEPEDIPQQKTTLQSVQESLFAFQEVCLLVLVDLCLLSEHYGLDGRLSSRIRHGALSNMIRSPFEEGALVTRKLISRDGYMASKTWSDLLSESAVAEDTRNQFFSAQAAFTRAIDGIVSNLQANLLQIRLPDSPQLRVVLPQYTGKPRGMFDYTKMFEAFPLYERIIGRNCVSTDEVIDRLLEEFVTYTSELLVTIRTHLQSSTQRELRELIDKFGADVRLLSLPPKLQNRFSDELTKARTHLQTMITQLCNWFYFKAPTAYPDYPLNVTYEAVLSAINNCSNRRLEYAVSEVPDIGCKGTHFHAFYDILFTLLYNVVEHSDLEKADISLRAKASVEEGHFRLSISNKVNPAKEVARLVGEANALISSAPSESAGRSAGEGRSGFLKIRRILVRDLKREKWLITASCAPENRFVIELSCEANGLFV